MSDMNTDHAYEHASAQDWDQETYMSQDYGQSGSAQYFENSSYGNDDGLAFPPHLPPSLPPRPKRRSDSSEGFARARSPFKANKADSDSSQGP